jgi:hypothetical protein
MKLKQRSTSEDKKARPKRFPRVAPVRSLSPERPTRVWSLLLPPTFPVDRK